MWHFPSSLYVRLAALCPELNAVRKSVLGTQQTQPTASKPSEAIKKRSKSLKKIKQLAALCSFEGHTCDGGQCIAPVMFIFSALSTLWSQINHSLVMWLIIGATLSSNGGRLFFFFPRAAICTAGFFFRLHPTNLKGKRHPFKLKFRNLSCSPLPQL